MPYLVKQMQLGPMQNYVYLLADVDTKQAAVVDPAWNVPAILKEAEAEELTITHAFLTHGHYDHIEGTEEVAGKTGAIVCAAQVEFDQIIYEGAGGMVIPRSSLKKTSSDESIRLGSLDVQMIPTPGHTPGSRCIFIQPKSGTQPPILFTGDTLFMGTIGRCDFPYSSPRDLYQTFVKLKKLPEETVIYPGHDYGASSTNTLAREKKTNPFLLVSSFEDFFQLVRH